MANFLLESIELDNKTINQIMETCESTIFSISVELLLNANNDGSGNNTGRGIISTIYSILEIIKAFETQYIDFSESHEILLYTMQKHGYYDNISPRKFHRSISKVTINESYYDSEDRFLTIISQIFGITNKYIKNPRSISIEIFDYDTYTLPVVVPRSSIVYYYDLGVFTPNFDKKFYVRGMENINFYPLSSLSSYQKLLGDILLTNLLRLFTGEYDGFAIFSLLSMLKFPATDIIRLFSKIKTDKINIPGIDDLANEDTLKEIYDRVSELKATMSLVNNIISGLSSSIFDYFTDEILNIIIGESVLYGNIENAITKLVVYPWKDASIFVTQNKLPRLAFMNTRNIKKSYNIRGKETIIQAEEIDIGGQPIKKRINSYSQILLTEEFIKQYNIKPIMRRIKVYNGQPVKVMVTYTPGNKKVDISFENNPENIVEKNAVFITLPVSKWNDAVNISQTISFLYSNVKLNKKYGLCKYEYLGTILSQIGNLFEYVDTFSVSINTKEKTFEINTEYIDAGIG